MIRLFSIKATSLGGKLKATLKRSYGKTPWEGNIFKLKRGILNNFFPEIIICHSKPVIKLNRV